MPRTVADKLLRLAGTPRQVYLCRVGFPGEYSQALETFDRQVELAGALLLGDAGHDRPRARAQASVPLRHAGLAYTKASTIASFAFLGAAANAAYALMGCHDDGMQPRFAAAIRTALADFYFYVAKRTTTK